MTAALRVRSLAGSVLTSATLGLQRASERFTDPLRSWAKLGLVSETQAHGQIVIRLLNLGEKAFSVTKFDVIVTVPPGKQARETPGPRVGVRVQG